MHELLEKFIDSQAEAVRIKSQALRPIIYICSVVWGASTFMMLLGTLWVQIFGGIVFSVVLCAALVAYRHFAVTDPDRLGSEAHVYRARIVGMLERSKDPKFAQVASILSFDPHPPRDGKKVLPERINVGGEGS